MRSWARLALIPLVALLSSCRASNPVTDSEIAAAEGRPWYDAYGEKAECIVPHEGCPIGSYDVAFADACVAKGYQAKSCGCIAVCSERVVVQAKPTPTPEPRGGQEIARPCNADELAFLATVDTGATTDVKRCLKRLTCEGDSRDCYGEARLNALRLRKLARGACRDQIEVKFCEKGLLDTLSCSDADLDYLSELYTKAFTPSELKLRRCLRDFLCNGGRSDSCSSEDAQAARNAKAATTRQCDYWLASFCSLDGK
jgi:hypothetical protein